MKRTTKRPKRDRRGPLVECACGCGAKFPAMNGHGRKRRFVRGHNRPPGSAPRRRAGQPNPLVECACGCGQKISQFDSNGAERRFIKGHSNRARTHDPAWSSRAAASYIGVSVDEYERRLAGGERWCGYHRAWHQSSAFHASAGRATGVASWCAAGIRKHAGHPTPENPAPVRRRARTP